MEIDAGFENEDMIVIMESKNVIHPDFQIRQLYYPYRKYYDIKQDKEIRLVFSQYCNQIYHLYEYAFDDLNNINSIRLVKHQAYTFEDVSICLSDLVETWEQINEQISDDMNHACTPFIQADTFDNIISLCEYLVGYSDGVSTVEIAEYLGMEPRQGSYYASAAKYLGLVDREAGNNSLSFIGREVLSLSYKERQLCFVELILEHEVFYDLFSKFVDTGSFPSIESVMNVMTQYNVVNCNSEKKDTLKRRARTVVAWFKWMLDLIDE
jgi:hypothetical protein